MCRPREPGARLSVIGTYRREGHSVKRKLLEDAELTVRTCAKKAPPIPYNVQWQDKAFLGESRSSKTFVSPFGRKAQEDLFIWALKALKSFDGMKGKCFAGLELCRDPGEAFHAPVSA